MFCISKYALPIRILVNPQIFAESFLKSSNLYDVEFIKGFYQGINFNNNKKQLHITIAIACCITIIFNLSSKL